ncbi:piezo-type mechanosensitive ion channel component isoform X4 [Tasmannia lanceolata]|uniref:piezo-type mechanosensitive ion channel component isoform X4 n=1 Tax=Tasmannia lanceolata TaxID=3420 RepID=UPI004063C750
MGNFLGGFVLPLLLLIAAILERSLISLVDLLAFLVIQFSAPTIGFHFQRRSLVSWCIIIFSLTAILAQVIFHIIWLIEGEEWTIADRWWTKLIGFVSVQPWGPTSVIYSLSIQLVAAFVALVELYGNRFGLVSWRDSCWGNFLSSVEHLGSHLRVACCLLLPGIQLVVGISHPSWVSLPFFICSCVGLVDWSLTSNFLGLFRWWSLLLTYAGFSIVLLYVYQLPIEFPKMVQTVANFMGFYKVSAMSEWPEICSGLSLVVFFFMLSCIKCDLEEMDSIMAMQERSLTEQLLPSKHSFFIRESRSGVRHTNVLLRGAVYRNFSINFFTYGFPVLLLALSFWSFGFASICAFGLLAYVGYILYAFPSFFYLNRLNGLLLVFILFWAASTYVFNVAFTVLNKKIWKDMEIWETVGLWHYPIPGFFLLAQFCLGVLVAMGNLVNNSVFLYLSDDYRRLSDDEDTIEEKEETKVLIVATIAWGLRKCSRAITLALIFLLAMKPGFIHAVYMVFFLVYLLSHTVSGKIRQSLILLCEAHFALLYIFQLNLISKALAHKGSLITEILSQLGLLDRPSPWDFMKIAVLACFCAVQNHGFKMLFSFSAVVQHTPYAPFGFSILKAGLNKSVLLSVYASTTARDGQSSNSSHGVIVDDPRMLISYYMVFIFASFKLRSDHLASFTESHTYRQMMSQRKNASVWRDLSFETKSLWTILDYLRLYSYCHLLDIVLVLILITGTLEYDILHLGYLGFALVFFRMRLEILKKKNKIFKFLRMYNFALIVLSLAYQSPFLGGFSAEKCEKMDYMYEVIGFYKYDYGFRITSRSALVEIIIFMLVSMQSYIFRSREFDYVARYLEAEQIGALVHEQEKRAAWKTAQLQHIRKSEEQKRQRNLQVEKMKAEMLNLQIQLYSMNSAANIGNPSPKSEGFRGRKEGKEEGVLREQEQINSTELLLPFDFFAPDTQKNDSISQLTSEMGDSPVCIKNDSPSTMEATKHSEDSPLCEITKLEEKSASEISNVGPREKGKSRAKENPLVSAVQLLGDSVSQVQSLGNQAVTNIVSFLNIEHEESDSNGYFSAEEGAYYEIESQNNMRYERLDQISSVRSSSERTMPDAASLQIGKIFRFIWAQMRSNNDVVCYCCFILVFLWNFSLLSMVYLAALFIYALCVNSGPSFLFWVIMLIYTEFNILVQYLYQIIIQHCGLNIHSDLLLKLGFPADKIQSSFVISTLPLFLVYISTLLQSSITAKDGEWESVKEVKIFRRRNLYREEILSSCSWTERVRQILLPIKNILTVVIRSFCRYWKSLIQGLEAPPYFVQLSMEVSVWPEDGIQPERIESGINKLLITAHDERCKEKIPSSCHSTSRVRVQSIERSQENSNMALAVFEVVYATPLSGCPGTEWYKSLTPAADVANEILKAKYLGLVEEIGFPYPIISVIGGGKREVDLYAYIFGADLAVFFLVAIFYEVVIKNNSKFLEVYQLEDQFPKEFVFVLMIIFFLIVLDRIIYLWSFAMGKVIFYLFNLFLFTYSVTEYAWYMEPSHQRAGFALRAIYLTKAVSLALQALQIRYGIPHKSTLYRQFLTSKIAQINYLGFRLYRALPFLYELRCVLDWSCTTTSLTMYDWLKLEDIHASLYLVKCDADLNRAKHKQGEKQSKMTKFCSGICLFLVLLCVIWAPMLMYSSGNPTNIANPIKDASVQIDIKTRDGRLTLYQTSLCETLKWEDLPVYSDLDPHGYLVTYNVKDIQLICCQPDASTLWLVPHVVQTRFVKSLWDMNISFSWVFTRDRPKGKEVVRYEISVVDIPKASEVEEVLNGTTESFRIRDIYPRYFRVTGSGEVRSLEQEVNLVSGDLSLNHETPKWWSFHDINALDVRGCEGVTGPMAIIVSEETPQGILGETLSKFSIWSLYLTFVLAVGRFIRLQCSDLRMRIPYENLPSCDRLIAICEDIYAARAEGELEVEEVLYWTLVKIYRSPHMLLEYTKPD